MIFGQPLGALECNQYGVPVFLMQVESLLQAHALGQEGLFRVPPPHDDLNHAQAQLDAGDTPPFFSAERLEPEQVGRMVGRCILRLKRNVLVLVLVMIMMMMMMMMTRMMMMTTNVTTTFVLRLGWLPFTVSSLH